MYICDLMDRSLFLAAGEGGIIGGSLDFWENKRGDRWKLWKDAEGETTQICLENEDMLRGDQKLLGESLQWSNIQTGDLLNFTLSSLKSPPPPPSEINNDRSLAGP